MCDTVETASGGTPRDGESGRRRALGVCVAAVAATVFSVAGAAQAPLDLPPRNRLILPAEICGTATDRARTLRLLPLVAATPGAPLSYEQVPGVITPEYTGTITFRRFLVAGDVASVRIRLTADGAETQTWPRVGTEQLAGQLVSVFEPSWSGNALASVLRAWAFGWDQPSITWAEVLPSSDDGPSKFLTVRIAPSSLPSVTVRRAADDVQYSSHVVNIVVPGFGDRFVADDHGFDLAAATRKFYAHFADSYESLAVVPQELYVASYGAFHRNVRNEVQGINVRTFNQSADYGSRSGRLQSVELFQRASLTQHAASAHEIAHQWGDHIDWTRLTGISRSGHDPDGHDPLWAEGETFIGSVLTATRRVARAGDGWVIERAADPRFHPVSLYSMGLIGPEAVPELTLFDDQAQFDPATSTTPDPGRAVTGATRTATIYNVIGMYGPRTGPVHDTWRRATVVVSRERLLSQREMDYWTFFAQRLGDPNRTGSIGYFGTGSFDRATGQRMDLRTEIEPLSGGAIDQPLPVDYPNFAPRDLQDVVFDAPLPSRYRVGERVTWSGVVNAERHDINLVRLRFWKAGGDTNDAIRIEGRPSDRGSFILQTQFEERHRGTYLMEVFLYWPDSGAQFSRGSLSPVTIN